MSILIRGKEMPTSCESCPCKTADAFGGLGCQATGYIPLRKANQDRPDGCPLVPIPPHGRLIDADALRAKQQEDADLFQGSTAYCDKCRRDEAMNAVANIVNAPTIIPAEPSKEENK